MPSLRKAVIPAAGFGTRMLPAAKAVPKEMLPILDRPTIQYVVEEAVKAGIDDVLLVTGRDKRAIEDHFDKNAELEQRLEKTGKANLLDSIRLLMERVQVHAVIQAEQKGLGHAVLQARDHIGGDAFLCMLGDTIFSPREDGAELPATQLVRAFERLQTPIIALEIVPEEKVSRYGIVAGQEISPGIIRVSDLVEKPPRENAPSRYAICARYILTPDVFACLEATTPGAGGEIQLTDALKLLLKSRPIHGVVLSAKRHDIGNPVDWLKTNLEFARRDATLWSKLREVME